MTAALGTAAGHVLIGIVDAVLILSTAMLILCVSEYKDTYISKTGENSDCATRRIPVKMSTVDSVDFTGETYRFGGYDIPLAPPVMQLRFKNLLHRFSPFRFTTYTRTAGFRVSESTHFWPRRDTKSVCFVGISKCLFPHRTTPLSHPRSQKV